MRAQKLIGELRTFAANPDGATKWLLDIDDVKALLHEFDRLVRAAGAVSVGPSFAEIVTTASRKPARTDDPAAGIDHKAAARIAQDVAAEDDSRDGLEGATK